MQTIKIIVADDHEIVRAGLRAMLSLEPGMEVLGEVSNGREAVEMVRTLKPDVVVMDIRMPELNGIDAAREAVAAHPPVKVVGLSADPDESLAVELLRAGAKGFVRKDAPYRELVGAIQAAVGNNIYCKASVIAQMTQHQAVRNQMSVFAVLTFRERQLLQLIAEGNSTKQIASQLKVSIKTVETHRKNLMAKLEIDNVAELTKYAVRTGLTPL